VNVLTKWAIHCTRRSWCSLSDVLDVDMPELPEEPTTTRLGGSSLTFVTAGQGASDADVRKSTDLMPAVGPSLLTPHRPLCNVARAIGPAAV